MPRRALPLLAAGLLALALAAGCASEVSPALRIGDDISVTQDDFTDELEAWAGSPTLLSQLNVGETSTPGVGGFRTEFAGFVLTTRISFELHNQEFESLGLDLSDELLQQAREGLFQDPAVSAAVVDELGPDYAEQLIADVARQFSVSQELGEEYPAWQEEAFGRDDIEVNPRYGSWDSGVAAVVPPEGPRSPAGADEPAFG